MTLARVEDWALAGDQTALTIVTVPSGHETFRLFCLNNEVLLIASLRTV